MTRPVRVVVTTTTLLTAATFLPSLMADLSRDHEVHLVCAPGIAPGELSALGDRLGVITHPLPMSRRISPLADLVALGRWVALLARVRPRILFTMTPKASLLAMLAGRVLRVPRRVYLLVGLRLEGEQGRRRLVLAAMERLTCGSATVVVANSPSLRDAAVTLGLADAVRVRTTSPGSSHGVDTSRFTPRQPDLALAAELGLEKGVPVVGFVGRVTHDKGLDDLLAASLLLAERGARHQLLVVGAQDEPDSQDYLRRLSASPVTVATIAHVDDVTRYYALQHVHVLPTLREGFPNVVLEASAMGVPTVTTRATGAVDSVVHDRTGLLVPVNDPAALADAVAALLDDPARRASMGAAARAWVAEEFRPERITASVLRAAEVRP